MASVDELSGNRDVLIVALGPETYTIRRPWGDLPAGASRLSDIAVDRRGHVFGLLRRDSLTDLKGPSVVELSPSGTQLSIWGQDLIQDGHMLSISPDGRIFIVDRDAHQVLIFSPDGRLLATLGERGRPNAPFNHPCGVTFGTGGRIFVCDGYGNNRIHCFSSAGEMLYSWGKRGHGPGQFLSPHAITAFSGNRIAVCDRYNHRLQIFSEEGKLIDTWSDFYCPTAISVDAAGNLYILDQVPSLTKFSPTGEEIGRCRPTLNSAHGVAHDPQSGTIYLTESSPSRISALVPLARGFRQRKSA